MGGVVMDKADFMHRCAALCGEAAAFDGQVLDQYNRIAIAQRLAIAVLVIGLRWDVIRPRTRLVIEVQLIVCIVTFLNNTYPTQLTTYLRCTPTKYKTSYLRSKMLLRHCNVKNLD